MQTFDYLIRRFMATPQAWLAQAIVSHLHRLKQKGAGEDICIDRLLPVWEVITENLMRRAQHPAAGEPVMPVPFGVNHAVHSQRALYEA